MDDVAQQWADDPDVMDMTDTDLTASRRQNANVSDTDRELHQLAQTALEHYEYPNVSWTLDTALRIELARLIDSDSVSFGREDFDVKYTIPQQDWYSEQEFEQVELVEEDDLTLTDRSINFSTAPVVMEMTNRVVHEGVYETISATVVAGLKTMLGQ